MDFYANLKLFGGWLPWYALQMPDARGLDLDNEFAIKCKCCLLSWNWWPASARCLHYAIFSMFQALTWAEHWSAPPQIYSSSNGAVTTFAINCRSLFSAIRKFHWFTALSSGQLLLLLQPGIFVVWNLIWFQFTIDVIAYFHRENLWKIQKQYHVNFKHI